MPDDALAQGSLPASQPAPAPAPAAPAPAAAPVAAPASPAAAPAAAAPTAADYSPLLSKLGYQTEDDLARDLAFTRQFRGELEQHRRNQERQDPARQQAAQRGEAFRQLVAEGYSPDHADALNQLPEISQFLNQQRADSAQRDLSSALGEMGLSFESSNKEHQEIFSIIEDNIADRLNADPRLNARYFGSPADRAAVIRELVGRQEKLINHVLLRQSAQTLRDHAQRVRSAPRQTALPKVTPAQLTQTDPLLRRREGNAAAGRQLDDIWSHYG